MIFFEFHAGEFDQERLWAAQGDDFVEDAVGEFALGHLGQVDGGGGSEEGGGVEVGVEANAFAGDVVEDDGVDAFAKQLGAAVFELVFGFGGEANDELAGAALADDFGEDVFCGQELDGDGAGALELLIGDDAGAVVGNGGGLDDQRGLGHAVEDGGAHLVGGGDFDEFDSGRAGRGRTGR